MEQDKVNFQLPENRWAAFAERENSRRESMVSRGLGQFYRERKPFIAALKER